MEVEMHDNRSNKHLLIYKCVLSNHRKCSASVEKLRIEGVIFFIRLGITDYCSEQSRKLSSINSASCALRHTLSCSACACYQHNAGSRSRMQPLCRHSKHI